MGMFEEARRKIRECIANRDTRSEILSQLCDVQKRVGRLEEDDPAVELARVQIVELFEKEEAARVAARAKIQEGIDKLKSSVHLKKLLKKEKAAGNLENEDPIVVAAKAKSKALQAAEES